MNPVPRVLLLLLVAAPSFAAESPAPVVPPAALAEAPPAVREGLQRFLPGFAADRIEPAAVAGLYRVFYGARLVYVSADGRYLVQGKVVDLANRRDLPDLALGRELGVEGTPTIVLEDGWVVPGYVPATELLRRLQQPAG